MNYKLFNKKNLCGAKAEVPELDTLSNSDNRELLNECRVAYDNLAKFRKIRKRCRKYNFGDQWDDIVYDSNGVAMTEKEMIMKNGKVPLKNNVIDKYTKAVKGLFLNNKTEPVAISRDRDEQKVGEMLSVALQYVYQTNNMCKVDADALEELLISGVCMQSVRYEWVRERNTYDVTVRNIDMNRMFCNSDFNSKDGSDMRMIGYLDDMSMNDVLERFAKSEADAVKIKKWYSSYQADGYRHDYGRRTFEKEDVSDENFLFPRDARLCRVIEVWTLESKERYRVHDELNGKIYIAELSDKQSIDIENARRIEEAMEQGVSEEDVPLMNPEWFVDQFWYVRYLTPDAHVLMEMETPFKHESNPFTMCLHRIFDGRVYSFVSTLIDPQRFINRYITMLDFMRGASAKGVLIFPEEMLGEMSKQEILQEWTKFNGVIFAKTKPGVPMPQQINTSVVTAGDMEMIQMQMKFLDEVSGIHGAIMGENAKSGTPSSLYAQQAQNSSINIVDLLETFNDFRRRRDMKVMKLVQQYYDSPRYINIAGKNYSEESKWYTPEKVRDAEFDISIAESASTPVVRMMMDDYLMQMFQNGAIDAKMMLENSSLPFADQLLASITRREEEMREQQQGAPVQQQGAPLEQEMMPMMQQQSNGSPISKALIDKAFEMN